MEVVTKLVPSILHLVSRLFRWLPLQHQWSPCPSVSVIVEDVTRRSIHRQNVILCLDHLPAALQVPQCFMEGTAVKLQSETSHCKAVWTWNFLVPRAVTACCLAERQANGTSEVVTNSVTHGPNFEICVICRSIPKAYLAIVFLSYHS